MAANCKRVYTPLVGTAGCGRRILATAAQFLASLPPLTIIMHHVSTLVSTFNTVDEGPYASRARGTVVDRCRLPTFSTPSCTLRVEQFQHHLGYTFARTLPQARTAMRHETYRTFTSPVHPIFGVVTSGLVRPKWVYTFGILSSN